MMAKIRDIGIDVKTPEGQWDGNENCPFYGSLRVRGQIIEGKVVSAAGMNSSIILERETTRYMPKYEREISEEDPPILRTSSILHRRGFRRRKSTGHGMQTALQDR